MEHSTGLEIIRKMPLPTSWWAKVGYPTRKVHEATSASIEALEGPYEGTTAFVDEKAIMRHAHTWASENTDPALAPIAQAILAGKIQPGFHRRWLTAWHRPPYVRGGGQSKNA
ncbi:hypothetical protein [Corynebacterium renale]|uniref:Uncharacterized protein n=1 Tax=Corynebacterium renale TaxID=1724 RepID=A0A2A9DQE3_9CORY|nr:hypothetical protein [Corynebacterium renale]PFG28814.1 hypothetical protein ATK06_1940 [Corynebacterium renale]SQI25700.1 Uncharacterised protein [Corynebacterium renale]